MKTINDLFAYIYSLAKLHRSEIYPRYFWHESKQVAICKYVFTFEQMADQRCMITDIGLSAAICGINYSKEKVVDSDQYDKNATEIKKNKDLFFIYNFELDIGTMCRNDSHGSSTQSNAGHQFKVIQYLNENKEVRYKFLQSYIGKYTLLDFLAGENRSEIQVDFSHEEFMEFVTGIEQLHLADGWNNIQDFYKKYFHVEHSGYLDHRFVSASKIEVHCIQGDMKKANEAKEAFNKYKTSKYYPVFIFLSGHNDHENDILGTVFSKDESNNQDKDYCALDDPWSGLIFKKVALENILLGLGKSSGNKLAPLMQRAQAKLPRNEIYFVIQLLYAYIDAPLFSYHHHKDKAMTLLRFIDNFHDNSRSINIEDIRSEIGRMKNNSSLNSQSGTFCSLCNFILSGELKLLLPPVKIDTSPNSNQNAACKLRNYAKIGFFEWRHHRYKAENLADLIDDSQKNVETILDHSTIDDKTNTVGAFAQTVREIRFN